MVDILHEEIFSSLKFNHVQEWGGGGGGGAVPPPHPLLLHHWVNYPGDSTPVQWQKLTGFDIVN